MYSQSKLQLQYAVIFMVNFTIFLSSSVLLAECLVKTILKHQLPGLPLLPLRIWSRLKSKKMTKSPVDAHVLSLRITVLMLVSKTLELVLMKSLVAATKTSSSSVTLLTAAISA